MKPRFSPSALSFHLSHAVRLWVAGLLCAGGGLLAADAPVNKRGEVIYQKLCLECHGKNGGGVKDKYDEPLHGNRTVEALAKRIARTMPDDDVGACVGEDAKDVAAYIYDAFYSSSAQARLQPPEFDLARLTIAQYRNSISDVVGRFRPGFDKPPGTKRGLNANYSGLAVVKPAPSPAAPEPPKSEDKNKKPEEKKPERTRYIQQDPKVDFVFGAASPSPEKLGPDEFSIRWDGSVITDETGVYEFIVKSENGVRLYVNDTKSALIDGWVSSGSEVRELKKSIFLLGGRSYPLMLEFFKFQEKTASVHLLWKPPHGVVQPIPEDRLSPDRLRESMIVKTNFPADDRSLGYERGTGVSKAWDQAATDAALDVVEHVDKHLDELAGSKSIAPDRTEKLKLFARHFAEAAFRRPLSEEDYQHLIAKCFGETKNPDVAVKRAVLFSLKSPRFLYPDLPVEGEPDGYDVATRLALSLWDSIPDVALLRAAAEGKLHTHDQIVAQANRMLVDPRTKAKLGGFFHHWLELERAEAISKDPKAFPSFDLATLADLRTSLMLFLDQVVWSDRSDYRELLQADYLFLNERLAKLYGKTASGETFQRVSFDPKQRAGVVTHPYLLAAFASSKQTSPIHRGVFLTRNIVGMTLRPPPNAVAFEDSKFDAHLTMREKITELTKNTSCMGCHATINPLGFSLENYDAIGRWRTKENDKPINAVTDFSTDEGQTIRLTGARDLVKFAVENPDGHRAFIHQLFQHTAKQAVNVYGPDTLEELRQSFTASGFNVRKLLAEIAVITASRGMPENK
ncbi:MAG: cytochrome c [Verrucomicrobiaceae bacterium]|nr:cytochrome c [Verrucomicrobiaceae bacterium]